MRTTGDAVAWGRVGWCLGEVSSSPGEAQSHSATWGHDSPSQHPAAGPQSTPWPCPATQQPSLPQPITSSISWGPVPTAPSPFPTAARLSILHTQTLPLGKPWLVGGTPVPPPLCCRGTGVPALPLHPPSLISISGQAGPGLPGGGRGTRRFPLIAKINTLKFLQEAEECGTAGKNCFIICNNTKGEGGGQAARGEGRQRQRISRGGEGCFEVAVASPLPIALAQCHHRGLVP